MLVVLGCRPIAQAGSYRQLVSEPAINQIVATRLSAHWLIYAQVIGRGRGLTAKALRKWKR